MNAAGCRSAAGEVNISRYSSVLLTRGELEMRVEHGLIPPVIILSVCFCNTQQVKKRRKALHQWSFMVHQFLGYTTLVWQLRSLSPGAIAFETLHGTHTLQLANLDRRHQHEITEPP